MEVVAILMVIWYLHVVVSVEGLMAHKTGELCWADHDLSRRWDPVLSLSGCYIVGVGYAYCSSRRANVKSDGDIAIIVEAVLQRGRDVFVLLME